MLLQRFAFYLIKRPEGLITAGLFEQRLQGSRDGALDLVDLRNAQPLRGHSRYQFARLSRHQLDGHLSQRDAAPSTLTIAHHQGLGSKALIHAGQDDEAFLGKGSSDQIAGIDRLDLLLQSLLYWLGRWDVDVAVGPKVLIHLDSRDTWHRTAREEANDNEDDCPDKESIVSALHKR